MIGKIISHDKNKLTIEFDEDINPEYLKLLSRGKSNYVLAKLLDNEKMSSAQNAVSHTLIRDIANHYFVDAQEMEISLKYQYSYREINGFSHSDATMDDAAKWIEFLIEFILMNGVELPKRYTYLLDYDKFFYFACKHRKCCVCAKGNGQIHHVTAVGNRKRKNVDHRLFPFACVCLEHHNIAHALGEKEFLSRYEVTPVYLDKETLIKIGITSNAQIMKFDEKYKDEELYKKAIGG